MADGNERGGREDRLGHQHDHQAGQGGDHAAAEAAQQAGHGGDLTKVCTGVYPSLARMISARRRRFTPPYRLHNRRPWQ